MSGADRGDTTVARIYTEAYPGAVGAAAAMALLALGWAALGQAQDGTTSIIVGALAVAAFALVVLLLTRRLRDQGWSVALQVLALMACAAVVGQVGWVGAGVFAAVAALLLFLVVVTGTWLRADRAGRAARPSSA